MPIGVSTKGNSEVNAHQRMSLLTRSGRRPAYWMASQPEVGADKIAKLSNSNRSTTASRSMHSESGLRARSLSDGPPPVAGPYHYGESPHKSRVGLLRSSGVLQLSRNGEGYSDDH